MRLLERARIIDKQMLALEKKKKKKFDERKQDYPVQIFGLQRPQRLDEIQAEHSFLLLIYEKEAVLIGCLSPEVKSKPH